jgi:hypothetical protein
MPLSPDRLLQIARDGSEDQLPPNERAEFDRFLRRVGVRRPTDPAVGGPDTSLAEQGQPTRTVEGYHAEPASVLASRKWRRWLVIFSTCAAVVVVVVAAFALGRVWESDRKAAEATAERDAAVDRADRLEAELERLRNRPQDGPPSPDHPFRLTANKANIPVDWERTLNNHYDDRFTPEENLTQLETVSGAVRTEVAKLRQKNPNATAKQFLDALFEAWGKPKP